MTEVVQKLEEGASEPAHNFAFYCRPENLAKIIGNRKLIFGTWALIGYVGQFILIVAVINAYSDDDRHIPCGIPSIDGNEEQVSGVYDMALRILASYHIIEWVRFVIFLTTMLLGSNFLPLWYILSLNTPFGIAAYIYCHVIRFSGNGLACAGNQQYRASMLQAEVIIFWVTFLIMSVPQIFIAILSKENLEKALVEGDEEEDEGDAKE